MCCKNPSHCKDRRAGQGFVTAGNCCPTTPELGFCYSVTAAVYPAEHPHPIDRMRRCCEQTYASMRMHVVSIWFGILYDVLHRSYILLKPCRPFNSRVTSLTAAPIALAALAMKKSIIFAGVLLSELACGAALAAEVCRPKLQSHLASCTTGRQFCTSLLGYSAGSSHTFTEYTQTTSTVTYTRTKYIASSTSFVTTILYGVTVTSTVTTTTSVPTETATS